ncbi:MAG: Rod shape-determining protein MreC [Candidatus Kaiserbacteria bacterium]|nr:Rod shape-determining protein MreC [Candidatus Kaiserbacteria bacterium]
MKERFVFGSSNRTTGRRVLLFATVAAVIVLAVDLSTHGTVRSFVRGLASHVWVTGETGAQSAQQSGFFATHAKLARDNASLRAELAQYTGQAGENTELRDENAQLRALVNLAARAQGVAAAVVSSYLSSPYGTFLISAHAPDVVSGDLVLSEDGFVVGKIADASGSTSLVDEIFASDSTVEGLVSGSDASIEGYGGGNARAELPRDVHVQAGDVVIVPAFGQRPVGIVGKVEASASSASQKVYIRLPANLSSLRYVYVVPAR